VVDINCRNNQCRVHCWSLTSDDISLLREEFVLFLQEYDTLVYKIWFQQMGARPRTSSNMLQFLRDVSDDKIQLNCYSMATNCAIPKTL
jgi:hypothetical protein